MSYVKTYLPTLKTHVVNLKRDTKDLSRDLQRLEVRGKLLSKTLYIHFISPSDREKCFIRHWSLHLLIPMLIKVRKINKDTTYDMF